MKNNELKYIFHSILPILIGGLIYIIFRTKSLIMFQWFSYLSLDRIVESFRTFGAINLPDWAIYSLPDALWIYSFTITMIILWNFKIDKNNWYWILFAPVFGISLEIAQLFGLKGYFDIIDLLFCLGFSLVALIQIKNFKYLNIKFKKS